MGIVHDLRSAFRLLLKERWSSAAAVLALALGIGANASGFAIVNAALLRGLPFEDVDRLFVASWQSKDGRSSDLSAIEFEEWRSRTRTMDLAASSEATFTVSDAVAPPEQLQGARLTTSLLEVLRKRPVIGRDFEPRDAAPGAEPVVLLAYRAWERRYHSDPNVIGATLRANGTTSTIVGVMPRGMEFPENAEIWTPFIPADAERSRDRRLLSVIARLKENVDVRQARAEMTALARQQQSASPDRADFVTIRLETFTEAFVGDRARTMFFTVMCAVMFVLLIACVNVANLLLARSASRAREIALRLAIGATRFQIVRQLLIESLLLSFIGGGIGLGIAWQGIALFDSAMQVADGPYWLTFSMDPTTVAYVTVACVVTTLLFGLAPAIHATRTTSFEVLKESSRGVTSSRRVHWFSGAMVVAELALTLTLVAGASLMMYSFLKLYTLDVGVDATRVLAIHVDLPQRKYPTVDARLAFFDRVSSALSTEGGIESSVVTTAVPPLDDGERLMEVASSSSPVERARRRFVSTVRVGPSFFEVLGRPLLRGRDFSAGDGRPGAGIVIVNERLAAQFFPGEDPIGRQIRFTTREPRAGQPPDPWLTIVGVSASIRQGSPQDAYLGPVVYIPFRQEPRASASLLLKTGLSAASAEGVVRGAVRVIDVDQPVSAARTIDELRSDERWQQRVFGVLFAVLASVAIVLSVVGLYGVMSHAVAERTQEIGVRLALGAAPLRVWWLVLRRGLIQLAIGVPLGIGGAVALGTVVQSMLVDMSPVDPATLLTAVIILAAVTVGACLVPARRATRVDPMVVLKG